MAPDDAADLIADLDQERRLSVLEALPQPTQAKVRALLSYNPETAGGLMSPEFLALSGDTSSRTRSRRSVAARSRPKRSGSSTRPTKTAVSPARHRSSGW